MYVPNQPLTPEVSPPAHLRNCHRLNRPALFLVSWLARVLENGHYLGSGIPVGKFRVSSGASLVERALRLLTVQDLLSELAQLRCQGEKPLLIFGLV